MKVLLAVDGSSQSELATRFVRRLLAELREASLVVVHVTAEGDAGDGERVATERKLLDERGLAYTFETGPGDPAEMIIARAQEHHCELIVLGKRGLGAVKSALLGSVSAKVAKDSSVPVTLVS